MRVLYVTLIIVVADQITKLLVKGVRIPWLNIHLEGMGLGTSKPVFGEFLKLTYIENSGMAFGIDFGGKMFFSVFSLVASIGILLYLFKIRSEHFPVRLSLAMILGGAVGNLIDRVFYGAFFNGLPLFQGSVVDFIDVDFFNIELFGYHLSRWPVFNIADASVTTGVFLLLIFHRRYFGPRESQPVPAMQGSAFSDGSIAPGDESGSGAVSSPSNPDASVKPDSMPSRYKRQS